MPVNAYPSKSIPGEVGEDGGMPPTQRIVPAAGQESVWDYPRPPRVEPSTELVEVVLGGVVVARTSDAHPALRVLETSHPPAYYLPSAAFTEGTLQPVAGSTYCEFKGHASYFDIVAGGQRAARAAWTYRTPSRGFESIADHVSVMPGSMDRCTVDGEVVQPQAGGFYGGWITARVVGPFKGGPGTFGW